MALALSLMVIMASSIGFTSVHGAMTDAVITTHPSTVSAALNANVTFTCAGYQYIIWKVNALQIASVLAQEVVNDRGIFANIDDQNSSRLFMLASQESNNTEIRCFVRAERNDYLNNVLRSDAAYLHVHAVESGPSPPSNLTITQSGLDLHLSWEAPYSQLEGEIIAYIVRATNTRSRESRDLQAVSPLLVFGESIGRRDCSLYEFKVYSVNTIGRSTTSVDRTIRIPTVPLVLQSADVLVNVSMEDVLSVTLTFHAPNPCNTYHVTSYIATFTDQGSNSSASFSVHHRSSFDSTLLKVDRHNYVIEPSKLYLVIIEARNGVGSMTSQPVNVYTTGLQSSSVMIFEVNDTASVTCNFALGSDALGCEVSFYNSSMSDSMELFFAQNITREPSSTISRMFLVSVLGLLGGRDIMNITVLTSEWLADGSISSIEIEAQIKIENFINTPDTTAAPIPPQRRTQFTTEQGHPTTVGIQLASGDVHAYTIVGSVLGGVVMVLCVMIVMVFVLINKLRKRRDLDSFHDENTDKQDHDRTRATNSYSPTFSLSTQPEDHDPYYSVIGEDSYVFMQDISKAKKVLIMATNPLYTDGVDKDKECHDPAYEEIKPKQMKEVKTGSVVQRPMAVYDEVKIDPDGVKLRGNESYALVGTQTGLLD